MSDALPGIRFQTKWLSRNPLVRRANNRFRDTLVSLVRSCNPGTILDAGCGEGINLLTLSGIGDWTLTGIDLDADSLQIAREALPQSVALDRGNLQALPYPDRSFDLVIGTEVLEHVDNPSTALQEMVRVSRHSLVLSVPREPIWRLANVSRGRYLNRLGNTPGHINHWSGRRFVRFCEREVQVLQRRSPLPWTFVLCTRRSDDAG